jgi:hypothetical protein
LRRRGGREFLNIISLAESVFKAGGLCDLFED